MPDSRTPMLALALATLTVVSVRAGGDPTPATPNVSYALDVRGHLYTIDRRTGAASFVATIPEGGSGLAIDSQGAMFTIAGGNLVRVDASSGSATAVGPVGPGGYGLTFDRSGALFAAFNTPNLLVRIDPATAAVTRIGSPAFALHESFSGLAVDPTTGAMYAMAMNVPALTGVLYRIDPTDAEVERIGETTAQVSHMVLDFDEAGTLYGASTALETLYTIDTDTGEETMVGPIATAADATTIVPYGAASYRGP